MRTAESLPFCILNRLRLPKEKIGSLAVRVSEKSTTCWRWKGHGKVAFAQHSRSC